MDLNAFFLSIKLRVTCSNCWIIHPSIFYTRSTRRSGRRGPGAYPSGHQARGGAQPGQVASPSQGHTETNETNNHTHSLLGTNLDFSCTILHVFGRWEEAGEPGENPRIHGVEHADLLDHSLCKCWCRGCFLMTIAAGGVCSPGLPSPRRPAGALWSDAGVPAANDETSPPQSPWTLHTNTRPLNQLSTQSKHMPGTSFLLQWVEFIP